MPFLGVLAAVVAALFGFGVGFTQLPSTQTGTTLAIYAGLFSAAAWAGGSICIKNPGSGGILNLVAAIFAAASVGYLTPPQPFCYLDERGWAGNYPAFWFPCRLRPVRWTEMDMLQRRVGYLDEGFGSLKKQVNQIVTEQITDLDKRIKAMEAAANRAGSPREVGPENAGRP